MPITLNPILKLPHNIFPITPKPTTQSTQCEAPRTSTHTIAGLDTVIDVPVTTEQSSHYEDLRAYVTTEYAQDALIDEPYFLGQTGN